jgi:hypothetical protein
LVQPLAWLIGSDCLFDEAWSDFAFPQRKEAKQDHAQGNEGAGEQHPHEDSAFDEEIDWIFEECEIIHGIYKLTIG